MTNNLRDHALDLYPQYLFLCMFSLLLISIFSINLLSNSHNPKWSVHESNWFSCWFNSLTQWVSETDNHTLKLQSLPQTSYCMTHHITPLIYIKRKPIDHFFMILFWCHFVILELWQPQISFSFIIFEQSSIYTAYKSQNGFGTSWWWVNHHHFHFWVNYVFT